MILTYEQRNNDFLTRVIRGKLPYYSNYKEIDIRTFFDPNKVESEKLVRYVVALIETDYHSRVGDKYYQELCKYFIENNNILALKSIEQIFGCYCLDNLQDFKVYHAIEFSDLMTLKCALEHFGISYCYEPPDTEINLDVLIELSKKNPDHEIEKFLKKFKLAVVAATELYEKIEFVETYNNDKVLMNNYFCYAALSLYNALYTN